MAVTSLQWAGCLLVGCLLLSVALLSVGAGADNAVPTTTVEQNNTTESPTQPVATVSGQTGAPLPIDSETGNPILATGQTQTIRVELQASNGTLGRTAILPDTDALAVWSTTVTAGVDSSQLIRPPVDPSDGGQRGFLTIESSENGTGVVSLVYESGDERRPLLGPDGDPLVFDVRPARPLSVDLSTTVPPRGGAIEVTVTRENGTGLGHAPVTLVDPDGTLRASSTANTDGETTIPIPADAGGGNWSIQVRTAGFEPVSVQTQVLVVGDSARHATDVDPRSLGYEDVNGDESVDLLDVETYLRYRDSRVVQTNPDVFDYNDDGQSGTVFDALALFVRVR